MTINTFLRHKKSKCLQVSTLVLVSLVYDSTILLFSFIAILDTSDKRYSALAFKPTPPSNQLPSNQPKVNVSNEYVFVRKWGSQGTGNGQFDSSQGIAVDSSSGNVYVADDGNNRIQVFAQQK